MDICSPIKGKLQFPHKNSPGSFLEDREDRVHIGIDIYCEIDSDIFSIEDGEVYSIGVTENTKMLNYWNRNYYVIIQNKSGTFTKYSELEKVNVKVGDEIHSGERIAIVGHMPDPKKIDEFSPSYIKKLKDNNQRILHLEIYKDHPIEKELNYFGGNWLNKKEIPDNLIDPTIYLKEILN